MEKGCPPISRKKKRLCGPIFLPILAIENSMGNLHTYKGEIALTLKKLRSQVSVLNQKIPKVLAFSLSQDQTFFFARL